LSSGVFLAARLRVRILLTCAARVRVGFMAANMLLGLQQPNACRFSAPSWWVAGMLHERLSNRLSLQLVVNREPLDRGEELASGP